MSCISCPKEWICLVACKEVNQELARIDDYLREEENNKKNN